MEEVQWTLVKVLHCYMELYHCNAESPHSDCACSPTLVPLDELLQCDAGATKDVQGAMEMDRSSVSV